MTRRIDRFFSWLSRLVLGVFFRRIEVVGGERLPASGPVIVVANHLNGLVDPLFLLGTLRLPVRFLGKSTLWKIPILGWLLRLARAIPVQRRQDEGSDPARNLETFAHCHELLRDGGLLALFPEGVSHDAPALQPLKTGAARILLEAERRFGPLGVRLLPVGLVFSAKTRFRSRALVVIGESIDPAPEIAAAATDEPAAVRALTRRIEEAIRRVTLNYESWEEARLVDRAAGLFGREALALPAGKSLAERFELQRALIAGGDRLERHHPERLASLARAVSAYDRLLRAARLRDDQVAADYPLLPAAAFVARTLAGLLLRLPIAAVGMAANVVPYQLVRFAAATVRKVPDQISTYKIFPSLLLFPATWIAESLLAARLAGSWSGLAALAAAPGSGWIALRYLEEERLLAREARAFLLLRNREGLRDELRARRTAIRRELEALSRELDAGT